jgi:3-oxoacyl-[acyl-carrier protein] reductase
MGKLDGKVALVTGAGSGIGRATALLYANEGARVAVNDLTDERAQQTVDELPVSAEGLAVGTDVSDSAQVAGMFAAIEERFGRLDVLVNTAGVPLGSVEERLRFEAKIAETMSVMAAGGSPGDVQWDFIRNVTDESFAHVVGVHLFGSFYCMRAAIDPMSRERSGTIVNFGSGAALMAFPASVHYSAAKAGILGMTRAAALELGPLGIRVNAICPGATDTPMIASAPAVFTEMSVAQLPLPRMAAPEEIASVALFLACDDSSYMTGQTVEVNGGLHM